MADEPWDELMGPGPLGGPGQSSSNSNSDAPVRREDPPPVRPSTANNSAPPAAVFAVLPAVAAPPPATAVTPSPPSGSAARKKKSCLAFEDEEEPDDDANHAYDAARLQQDGASIRQAALKMLAVADHSHSTTRSSSQYSVHRTVTGGFMATLDADEEASTSNQKRVPRALAGVSFAASRRRNERYRDDSAAPCLWQDDLRAACAAETDPGPFSTASPSPRRDDNHDNGYHDDDNDIVDVVGMERRSSSYRDDAASTTSNRSSASSNNNNWSSRYSLDHTLLGMAGGTLSRDSSSLLRELSQSQRERDAARNLVSGSAGRNAVFGNRSGFSFRQNHIFGQQQATVPQPNLHTVWIDGHSASLPAAEPRKSWQEQLQQKRKQRRRYMALAVLFAIVLAITLGATLGTQTSVFSGWTKSGGTASLTFYVTSDVPYNQEEQEQLTQDLEELEGNAAAGQFLVHLGNLQDAAVTLCAAGHYENVASQLLSTSPLPTFVLPGEQDWQACPNPDAAWDHWKDHFGLFDGHFAKPFSVERSSDQPENFAFVQNGVLLLGLHLVAGPSNDRDEIKDRNDENLDWLERKMEDYEQEENSFRAIVVFGNARPGHPANEDFFEDAVELWNDTGKPVAYVHAAAGNGIDSMGETPPWPDADNVVAVQVPKGGGGQPPLRINVGFGNSPFVVG